MVVDLELEPYQLQDHKLLLLAAVAVRHLQEVQVHLAQLILLVVVMVAITHNQEVLEVLVVVVEKIMEVLGQEMLVDILHLREILVVLEIILEIMLAGVVVLVVLVVLHPVDLVEHLQFQEHQ